MKIFGKFFWKTSSFWQFFDIHMAIFRRFRTRVSPLYAHKSIFSFMIVVLMLLGSHLFHSFSTTQCLMNKSREITVIINQFSPPVTCVHEKRWKSRQRLINIKHWTFTHDNGARSHNWSVDTSCIRTWQVKGYWAVSSVSLSSGNPAITCAPHKSTHSCPICIYIYTGCGSSKLVRTT